LNFGHSANGSALDRPQRGSKAEWKYNENGLQIRAMQICRAPCIKTGGDAASAFQSANEQETFVNEHFLIATDDSRSNFSAVELILIARTLSDRRMRYQRASKIHSETGEKNYRGTALMSTV